MGGPIIDLDDPAAGEVAVAGGKAAALARGARSGLRTLPGVVLTTAFSRAVDEGTPVAGHPALREAVERLGGPGTALVARSSSVVEDAAASSRAGQFASVIGVTGVDELAAAVREVLDSRLRADAADQPIAVLVQPLIRPRSGGVLFGVDPVTGRSDRRVVTAVDGGPEPLVSGEVDGSRYLLDADGQVIESTPTDEGRLDGADLRRLHELSERVEGIFGGPQDVEWAIDGDGELWVLQSRPVTTEVAGVPHGPVYGPGPVAETFPEPLSPLEVDMWVQPLREAVREAVRLAGAATDADLERTEAVVTVGGRVAIDLRLAGVTGDDPSVLDRLNPLPRIRRLRSAWRVGRLRAALPTLADDLLDRVDVDLESVPPVGELTSRQLMAVIRRGQQALRSLHAHEMLMGLLTKPADHQLTAASAALRVLSEARRDGMHDDEILARSPVVLALTAPRVSGSVSLPPDSGVVDLLPDGDEPGSHEAVLREALRLRVRWLQELTARAAWELAMRFTAAGALARPDDVRHLDLAQVEAFATKRAMTTPELVVLPAADPGPPLPARFQLTDRGRPVMVRTGSDAGGGTGAGGGSATGVVTHDPDDPPDGSVLVTTTLTPALGPRLGRLAGIVAETGSVLSHLAILARESGVAIVVGYPGAVAELAEGSRVTVDGTTGDVTVEADGVERAAGRHADEELAA